MKIDEIEAGSDCDDLNVQSLEQYKEFRTLLVSYKNTSASPYGEEIVVNEDNKLQINLAAKNLAKKIIELCK